MTTTQEHRARPTDAASRCRDIDITSIYEQTQSLLTRTHAAFDTPTWKRINRILCLCKAKADQLYGKLADIPRMLRDRQSITRSAGIAAVASCLCGAMVFGFSQVNATPRNATESAAEQLKALIHEKGFADVNVSRTQDGRIDILGIVGSVADAKAIYLTAQPFKRHIQHIVVDVADILIESVTEVLHQYDLDNLKTTYHGGGRLRISGYVGPEQDWDAIHATLKRDFPNIRDIDDANVQTLSDRLIDLKARLYAAGLGERLKLTADHDSITASGVLDLGHLMIWDRLFNEFEQDTDRKPRIHNKVMQLKPDEKPDLQIGGIMITSHNRFLVTGDGTVYNEGETLPDGTNILAIAQTQVTLVRNGHEYVYPFR